LSDLPADELARVVLGPEGLAGLAETIDEQIQPHLPRLTPKQMRILVLVRDYQRKHGFPRRCRKSPTRWHTKVTVFEHVGGLEKKGLLRRSRHRARSWSLRSDLSSPTSRRGLPL
jgi:hypothetical protein